MKPFGALLSFEEAKKVVEANIRPVNRVETVDIDEASGRVLADDIVATLSTPPFDRAAMDGYAVQAKDTFNSILMCSTWLVYYMPGTHRTRR